MDPWEAFWIPEGVDPREFLRSVSEAHKKVIIVIWPFVFLLYVCVGVFT